MINGAPGSRYDEFWSSFFYYGCDYLILGVICIIFLIILCVIWG